MVSSGRTLSEIDYDNVRPARGSTGINGSLADAVEKSVRHAALWRNDRIISQVGLRALRGGVLWGWGVGRVGSSSGFASRWAGG